MGMALVLGFVAVFFSNTDTLHGFVRFLRLTREASYSSEWYSAFHHNPDCYVVLHLQGQRRLYGWPEEWPSRPDQGHFRIAEGEWLVGDERIPAEGVVSMVVPAREVDMLEFLRMDIPEEDRE